MPRESLSSDTPTNTLQNGIQAMKVARHAALTLARLAAFAAVMFLLPAVAMMFVAKWIHGPAS